MIEGQCWPQDLPENAPNMRDSLNENSVNTRKKHKYTVKFAKTQKLYKFAIPAMQRILNNQ